MGFASSDNVIGTGSLAMRGSVLGANAIGPVLYNQGGTFTPTPPPAFSYLLMESSGYILLEDGSKFILEP